MLSAVMALFFSVSDVNAEQEMAAERVGKKGKIRISQQADDFHMNLSAGKKGKIRVGGKKGKIRI
ncbi:hypothetical protein J7384_17705 [Endozoicomonas sp. G2_1]|uniref:hypothetical protein n=1 Tax=Endozoicomonas sp. G2_1 TaxID=2821091 RepID=UPI001AD97258|nr:hypothetical protein [Endozoicomonas sp. G2_1]MBO9492201.1 hypothetical protein [Endozoicomonas sp. G2_1]